MSSRSFVSNDDSTSICAADAPLDIRYAFDMALKRSICVALGQRERSNKGAAGRIATIVAQSATYRISNAVRNISIARQASKYRVAKQHIDKIKE